MLKIEHVYEVLSFHQETSSGLSGTVPILGFLGILGTLLQEFPTLLLRGAVSYFSARLSPHTESERVLDGEREH